MGKISRQKEISNSQLKPRNDPLFRLILGVTVFLIGFTIILYAFWGSGPVVANVFSFVMLFMVAFLAIGRYQIIRQPSSYWVGIAYVGLGIGTLFFVLSFPGLLPDGKAIIASSPNTSSWIGFLAQSIFITFLLLAIFAKWPAGQVLSGWRWLWSILAWLGLLVLAGVLSARFEQYLPGLISSTGAYTPLNQTWNWLNTILLAGTALLALRRYFRTNEPIMGYVALNLLLLLIHQPCKGRQPHNPASLSGIRRARRHPSARY